MRLAAPAVPRPRDDALRATAPPRSSDETGCDAARSRLAFRPDHTREHPNSRCPVLRPVETRTASARASSRATTDRDVAVRWTEELDHRDGSLPATSYRRGLVGRAHDPEGRPDDWRWPDDDRRPPGRWIARSAIGTARAVSARPRTRAASTRVPR